MFVFRYAGLVLILVLGFGFWVLGFVRSPLRVSVVHGWSEEVTIGASAPGLL